MKYIYKVLLLVLVMPLMSCLSSMMQQSVSMAQQMQKNMMGEVADSELGMEIINYSTLQKVIETSLNKEEINSRLNIWISENLYDELILNKQNNDIIEGKSSLLFNIEYKVVSTNVKYYFDFMFEIKDNKIRLTLSKPYSFIVNTRKYYGFTYHSEPTLTYASADELRFISKALKKQKIIDSIFAEKANKNQW